MIFHTYSKISSGHGLILRSRLGLHADKISIGRDKWICVNNIRILILCL